MATQTLVEGRSTPVSRTAGSGGLRRLLTGYGFLAPSLIGVFVFLLAPVGIVIALAFAKWNLISPLEWVGTDNFSYLFGDRKFLNSIWVTILFTALAIPLTVILGLLLAVMLNRKLPGTSALRVLYVLPWVCAPLALGVVWKWIFAPTDGALNAILGVRIEWLSDLGLALPSVAVVHIWSKVGYVSLFFLAGLQQIPISVYEAAKLDGANAFQTLWRITMPLLRPTTFFVSVTSVISSFQIFDTVYAMTGGGPAGRTDVIASRIYSEGIESLRIGRGAAMAVILLVVLVLVTVGQQLYFRKRLTYDMS